MSSNKSKFTKDDVLKLAKLASLSISDSEAEKYSTQLGAILDYVNQLQELDTDNIEPIAHITGTKNITFEDGSQQDFSLNKQTLNLKKVGNKDYFSVTK